MSDVPPRRPRDPEEERDLELGSAAYEANVPGRMTGFRGTNPIAFVIAGVLAIGIVLFAAVAFFHRGTPADNSRLAQLRAQQSAGPAAPGLGGALQTPFIPEGTPAAPSGRFTPLALLPFPSAAPQTSQPVVQYTAPPQATQPPSQIVPAPAEAAGNDEMKIAQPAGESPGPNGSPAASGDAEAGTHYVPVYHNGQLVSVVAVENSPTPQPSASPPQSAQFVAGAPAGGLGSANAGLIEARKFASDNDNAKLGYVRSSSNRQLTTATVLNARLMSKIESDLPGPVIAQITQPVYDSSTHTTVVIPAGTRVFGKYDEETVSTSTRLLMSFTRIIFPDGEEFDIGGQPASDAQGAAGLTGDVDTHRGTLYTSALLLTVLGGAEAAVTPQTNTLLSGPSVSQQAQSAAGAQLDQLGNKLLDKAVDRPSTIIVRPPFAFQIIVTRDLPLDEYAAQHQ